MMQICLETCEQLSGKGEAHVSLGETGTTCTHMEAKLACNVQRSIEIDRPILSDFLTSVHEGNTGGRNIFVCL